MHVGRILVHSAMALMLVESEGFGERQLNLFEDLLRQLGFILRSERYQQVVSLFALGPPVQVLGRLNFLDGQFVGVGQAPFMPPIEHLLALVLHIRDVGRRASMFPLRRAGIHYVGGKAPVVVIFRFPIDPLGNHRASIFCTSSALIC